MEVPQGNSLCSYLKQPKMSFFSLFFSYTKLENRRMKQILQGVGRKSGTSGSEEEVKEGEYVANTVYTCM
jgi:hypothetical protein